VRARVVAIALAIALIPTLAAADTTDDQPELVRMRFVERGDWLTATTKLNKLFDSGAYDALGSGIPSTVVIRMWVYPQGSNEPIAFTALERSCVYDLWDEVYTLQLTDQTGKTKVKVKKRADALEQLTELADVQIAELALMPYDQVYQLAIEAELNPVSKETQAEVRRWLSKGTGEGLDHGSSFFGSFVSVFVNSKIPEADRVVLLRSQPFYRPKPQQASPPPQQSAPPTQGAPP
jgi:hypothetical protein